MGCGTSVFNSTKTKVDGLSHVNWTQTFLMKESSGISRQTQNDTNYDQNLLILYNTTLIDGKNKLRPNVTITISDNEIVDLINEYNINKFYYHKQYPNSTLIDLTGKYVLPGLMDMHAHVAGVLKNSFNQTYSEEILQMLVAHGITTIRNPGGPTNESVGLKNNVSYERIIGPQIFTAGSLLNSPSVTIPFVEKKVNTVAEVEEEITNQVYMGVDFVKLYVGLTPNLVKEAIDKAHSLGIGVIGHLYFTSWTEASNDKIDFLTHGVPVGPSLLSSQNMENFMNSGGGPFDHFHWLDLVNINGKEINEMVKNLVKNNVYVDPTLSVYESMVEDSPLNDKTLWLKILQLTKKMFDSGVKLLSGTDIPNFDLVPGKSLHHELELLANAGIPTYDVVQIATKNGAEALRILESTGTIEEGKQADLLVLSSNPIENISNIKNVHMVINNGKIIDRIGYLLR
jgi:imidazolonepropionase-like amidohydrolase